MGELWTQRKTAVFLLIVFYLVAGCQSDGGSVPAAVPLNKQEIAVVTQTAVPTITASPTETPTSTTTPSPTATATPTATAVPITITGNPKTAMRSDPEPEDISWCGVVDFLDFPLDPPDALSVHYGGRGFGQFRSRYDQYHAGEDWQLLRGQANLGVPVYAIGHGRVTYAHPNGWGTDKGVIIIRHTFADGSNVLSFYGHMEPESVTLRAGECVVRGQKIAEIGQPRTPPHLHFEIRTHMPEEPGPGYWPVDPMEAGWLPPSQVIWENRMSAMPGVVWTQPLSAADMQAIELVVGNTFISLTDDQLSGFNLADGSLSWQQTITGTMSSALAAPDQSQLYMVNRAGKIAAYPLLTTADGTISLAEEPAWYVTLDTFGLPTLLPLPGGGLIVSVRQNLTAVSAKGKVLWQAELEQRPLDWLLTEDELILTVSTREGPIYSVTTAGLQAWPVAMNGRPIHVGDEIWLYAFDGLYRLDPITMTANLLQRLPPSFFDLENIIALPDGGAMIAHRERDDSRLIAFAADGSVQWQRSYAQLGGGERQLLLHDDKPYLLVQSGSDITTQLKLYAIDIPNSTIRHIFTGGTRTPISGRTWFYSTNDDVLLINVAGKNIVALAPKTAVSLITSLSN